MGDKIVLQKHPLLGGLGPADQTTLGLGPKRRGRHFEEGRSFPQIEGFQNSSSPSSVSTPGNGRLNLVAFSLAFSSR